MSYTYITAVLEQNIIKCVFNNITIIELYRLKGTGLLCKYLFFVLTVELKMFGKQL